MGQFDNWAHRAISRAQYAKKKAAERKSAAPTYKKSAPSFTNLSLQYDNDGNPIYKEPEGYDKGPNPHQ